MIQLHNVTVKFKGGIVALRDASFTVNKGEFVFIVGPTGSGKSTVLKLINRELLPTSGKVIVNGINVATLRPSQVPFLRRSIGFVFQDFLLLQDKTVWENVAFALKVIGAMRSEIRDAVCSALQLVGLIEKWDAYPRQLSGGEQQKVCIARAIVNNPLILLADEPTGNLDPDSSLEIASLLERVNQRGTTVVVATHDKYIVDFLKKRVIELRNGTVVRDEPEGVYRGALSLH
ncbi:MAG: cell division ATP-binding protein FtsE [Armatimonadota bacterium]|nr:cell division ATP-binding protein FtsE [Armatimonadota bacterium]MCX7776458.1 cell division ATP-binding protein FtsE [Armatimonadota bacterium]MDW8024256.1 cell division ATP-binding protein FtsE [Armatimonadota bacterium]